MRRLLKAEFLYHKSLLIIPYLLVLVVILVNFSKGWERIEQNVPGTKTIMVSMIAVVYFVRLLNMIKEKRERFQMLLPLSITQIGFFRLIFTLVTWLSFLILFWIGTSTVKPYQYDLIFWDTLSVTGFVIIANAFPFIYRDLTNIFSSNISRILLMVFYSIAMIVGIVIFNLFGINENSWKIFKPLLPLKENVVHIFYSWIGALIFLGLGFCLTGISLIIFKRRKTYID